MFKKIKNKKDIHFFKSLPEDMLLILERGKGREEERERNTDVRVKHRWAASCMCPNWGLNLQPRHVP